jgi:dynein heavy chain
VTELAAKLGA